MKRRVDRAFAIGAIGASAILIFVVMGAVVPGENFVPGPYGSFAALLSRLGYQVSSAGPGEVLPERDVVLALGDYVFGGEDKSEMVSGEELEGFLERGGIVIAAGSSGLNARVGELSFNLDGRKPIGFGERLSSVVKAGALEAENAFVPPPGATVLASLPEGVYVAEIAVGKGTVFRFADDWLFRDAAVSAAEGPVLVNELLGKYWGRRVVFVGRSLDAGASLSVIRLLSFPGAGPIALFAAAFAVLAVLSLAVRSSGIVAEIPGHSRSVRAQTEAVGDFYRKNSAYGLADGFLSARFGRHLTAAAPAAGSATAAAVAIAREVGLESSWLMSLAKGDPVCSMEVFEGRRKARAAVKAAIRKRYRNDGGNDEST